MHSLVRCGVRRSGERVLDAIQRDANGHYGEGQGGKRAGREPKGGKQGGESHCVDACDSPHAG